MFLFVKTIEQLSNKQRFIYAIDLQNVDSQSASDNQTVGCQAITMKCVPRANAPFRYLMTCASIECQPIIQMSMDVWQ